jgi:DNA-binding response OmpR family regulator
MKILLIEDSGFRDYIAKPISINEFAEVVRT